MSGLKASENKPLCGVELDQIGVEGTVEQAVILCVTYGTVVELVITGGLVACFW